MDDNYLDLYLDYSEMLQEARDENAKLREENAKLVKVLHEVESEAVDAYLGLQHDCELLVGELDDRFRKYWHEQCENAKLRELVLDALTTISWCTIDCCPSDNKKRELNARARELGVEP